jgi:hypothetical protein
VSSRVSSHARSVAAWDSVGVLEQLNVIGDSMARMLKLLQTLPDGTALAGAKVALHLVPPMTAVGTRVMLSGSGVAAAVAVLLGVTADEAKLSGLCDALRRGPSIASFAKHCWEALEGYASGSCPFVGTDEYHLHVIIIMIRDLD